MTAHPPDARVEPEFRALPALSARLGRDPLRAQAAGGNTSLKRDGVPWIKASGTWLAETEARDIMVPVARAPLLGRGITVPPAGATPGEMAAGPAPPLMLVLPGKGVLLHQAALRRADELARGLADVTARISRGRADPVSLPG